MEIRNNASILKDAIEHLGFEARPYSGRGMYGRTCTAMVVDNNAMRALTRLITTLYAENAMEDVDCLLEEMGNVKIDNMGLGAVVYWPDIAWAQDDE